MYIGILATSLGIGCMGLNIENNDRMVAALITLRFIHGFFRTFILVPSFSIVVIIHPQQKYRHSANIQCLSNFGSAIGPVIGSVLYKIFGYFYMFVIFGISFMIFIPLMMIFEPANINDDQDDEEPLNQSEQLTQDPKDQISLYIIF